MTKKLNFNEAYLYLISYSSFTYIFLILNFYGHHHDSLTIGIFQALVSFITLGFSGDFRSLYFTNEIYSRLLIKFRSYVITSLLVGMTFYFLVVPDSTLKSFVLLLLFKRLIDWIDEVVIISSKAFLTDNLFKYKYILIQVFFIIFLPYIYLNMWAYMKYYFLIMIVYNFYILKRYYMLFYIKNMKKIKFQEITANQKNLFVSQLISTSLLNLSNIALRVIITISFLPQKSSMIISSFALGSMAFSMANNSILPYVVQKAGKVSGITPYLKKNVPLIFTVIFLFVTLLWFLRDIFYSVNLSFEIASLSLLSSATLFCSSFFRYSIIQFKGSSTLRDDFFIHSLFILTVLGLYINWQEYLIYSTILLGSISLSVFAVRHNALTAGKFPPIIYLCVEIYLLLSITYLLINKLVS